MVFWIALLSVLLYLLYKVSEIAERELVKFAENSGITHLAIGFIFLAAATALPELTISVSSAFLGNQEIAVGVSLGNVMYGRVLIIPIVAMLYGLKISETNFRKILNVSIISLIALFPILFLKEIGRVYGIALVTSFIILSYFLLSEKPKKSTLSSEGEKLKNKIAIGLSLISLSFLATLINISIKYISEITGISTLTIGSIFVSIFTSLPELIVCLHAAKIKNYDIIVGTIYGTLAFDTLFLLGSTSIIAPIVISNFHNFIILYSFLSVSLISIILMIWKRREIGAYDSIFLLMLLALWIFLSILIGI